MIRSFAPEMGLDHPPPHDEGIFLKGATCIIAQFLPCALAARAVSAQGNRYPHPN